MSLMGASMHDGLATDRLILEPLRLSHADEMVSVLEDDLLYEYIGGAAPSRDALVARYAQQIRGPGQDGGHWFNWIVRRTDTGDAVGYVQATVIDDRADVAWLVGVDHQRRGFAREAADAMFGWLAEQGVGEFSAHIAIGHVASARVAEQLGMERTGAVDDEGEEVWSRRAATTSRGSGVSTT